MLECSQISKGPVVQSTSSFDVFLVDTHKGQLIHLRSSSVSSRSFWKVQCLFLLDCRYVCFFLFYCLVSLFFQEIDSFIRHVVGNYAMISWAAPEGLLGTLYTYRRGSDAAVILIYQPAHAVDTLTLGIAQSHVSAIFVNFLKNIFNKTYYTIRDLLCVRGRVCSLILSLSWRGSHSGEMST